MNCGCRFQAFCKCCLLRVGKTLHDFTTNTSPRVSSKIRNHFPCCSGCSALPVRNHSGAKLHTELIAKYCACLGCQFAEDAQGIPTHSTGNCPGCAAGLGEPRGSGPQPLQCKVSPSFKIFLKFFLNRNIYVHITACKVPSPVSKGSAPVPSKQGTLEQCPLPKDQKKKPPCQGESWQLRKPCPW